MIIQKKHQWLLRSLIYIYILFLSAGKLSAQIPGGAAGNTFIAWLTPDNYNNGTWTNLIVGTETAGNFSDATTAPVKSNTGGYNFHPAIVFNKTANAYAPNQLYSQHPIDILPNNSITTIFVLQRKTVDNWDFLIGFSNMDNYNAVSWRTNNSNELTFSWGGTARTIGQVKEGILTIDNSNLTATDVQEGTIVYNSGAKTAFASNQWNGSTNIGSKKIAIGGGSNTQAWYGYQGNLQEVILIKNQNNGHVSVADMKKIHSYLAVKYGITLNNSDDYLNSDGNVVWSRTLNSGYNNNIFGIGRDNATNLNQVQSRSVENDALTIYTGTLNTLNNNKSTALTDKSFLMLGSNKQAGNTLYEYPAGTSFLNKNLTDKINYRSNTIYKAQVTTGGVKGGSQTVNMNVTATNMRYILVSADSVFQVANTRVYQISALAAANVLINDGEYVAMAGYQSVPGGALNTSFVAWLTPDSYNNGTWTNLISEKIGDFTGAQAAPLKKNTGGYNFHPVVAFDKSVNAYAPNQLYSQLPIDILPSNNIAAIFVLQRKTVDNWDYLMGFSNLDNYNAISWRTYNSNELTFSWGGTARSMGQVKEGILTIDNSNVSATAAQEGTLVYKDGAKTALASNQWNGSSNAGNKKVALGGGGNNQAWYGYQGNLQEVILIKNPGNGHINNIDMKKIHSYLSIKYGITLNNSDDYLNSDGSVVWNRTENAGYNNNIFGIGRDDASGLYQKQSQNVNYKTLTIFAGNTLAALNSQNTGRLEDKQYLMIGSNGGKILSPLKGVNDGDVYSNGTLSSSNGFNIQSAMFKAQVSGPLSSMKVNMTAPANDFIYALVSIDDTFTPGNTKIYPVSKRVAEIELDQDYKFIKFIGFAPGPGGVSTGLLLWLRADDDASITIDDLALNDAKLTGYPDPVSDPNAVPGVSVWQDLARDRTYSYSAATVTANHYMPVYKSSSPQMNYHPALRFWSTNTNIDNLNNYGAWLTNPVGLMASYPPNGQHTAYMLVNNNFSDNPWFFAFSFSANSSTNLNTSAQPGYGANRPGGINSTNTTGWFRPYPANTNSTNQNMFIPGATTMMGFHTKSITDRHAYYRFNAVESNSGNETFNWTDVRFNNPSLIGGAWASNRVLQGVMSEIIFYDRTLTDDETQKLESYLALKYGITLYPNNANNRYTYKLSNDSVIWEGNQPAGNPYVTFYNNVAAVIRDDAARLNNRQAHSTNVGSLLHLGVAGTMLSADGNTTQLGELDDMEAVAFGSDGISGNTPIDSVGPCSPFTHRFNRKWLIHKTTKNDRPITLLVGAQNNGLLTIGQDTPTASDYYSKLNSSYDVTLIIADSPEDIEAGIYKAVIPMTYINGEHQCNYTFTDKDTYITFGWKVNTKGCMSDENATFAGAKTFKWTQWTYKTNNSWNPGLTLSNGQFDLGDDIIVTGTTVTYPNNVRANWGYPRSVNTPEKGSLEVQRRGGINNQDVVINITFNHPVIPEFSISGLDSYWNTREEVEIYGECSGGTYLPVLNYASAKNKNTSYVITGNTATVNKRVYMPGNNNNGKLNVTFEGGVTSLTIKYRTKNAVTRATQRIYISPITLRSLSPAPPVNEDGLSFVKQVKERNITTCEPAEYTFFIQNVNCDPMSVDFRDILPEDMTWDANSIGLDAVSSDLNKTLNTQIIPAGLGRGEELQINGLIVPGASTLILKATALLDEDAPDGYYSNRAFIRYNRIINNTPVPQLIQSLDRETLDPNTVFFATHEQRQEKVVMKENYSRQTYNEDNEIEVTYTLTNANPDITDMYLDINFNEEFEYVANSLQVTSKNASAIAPVLVTPDPQGVKSSLTIAGSADGADGFTLPTDETVIKFKLKAPALADLKDELDGNGQPTGKKAALEIIYSSSSTMEDPCAMLAIDELHGYKSIPYSTGKSHVVSNKFVTTKIAR